MTPIATLSVTTTIGNDRTTRGRGVSLAAEQVRVLNSVQPSSSPQIQVRQGAVIESYWDQLGVPGPV